MAWNESGGPPHGRNQNPWGQGPGRGGNGQQPPDLDEVIRNLRRRLRGLFGGGRGGGGLFGGGGGGFPLGGRGIALIVGLVIVIWFATGIYVVAADEQGVVKRFGKHVATVPSGLHYHLPWPIETVHTPKVTQIRRAEIGFRSQPGDQGTMHVDKEALMLTGNEAVVDLQFAVQYHIKDAGRYLFNVKDPDETVRSVAETAIREVVGQRPIDDVLTRERAAVAQETRSLMQEKLDGYGVGLQITNLALQDAQAPKPVRPAFRDVISAREDRTRAVNRAQAYANDVLPRARGQAERVLQEAQGYKAKVVNRAQGSASRFRDVYQEYREDPQITAERLYLETMERVLGRGNKVVVDLPKSGNLMYLPLQELLKQKETMRQVATDQQAGQGDQGGQKSSGQRVDELRQKFEKQLENIRQGRSNR